MASVELRGLTKRYGPLAVVDDISLTIEHGMIFQSYALWPHMTVTQNVSYGLDLRKVDREC